MKQQRIYYRRLKKLENHLRNGKLGHKKFDFSRIHTGKKTANNCGTLGCAIGECPVIFPKDWEFRVNEISFFNEHVILKGSKSKKGYYGGDLAITSSMKFFGINDRQADHLFVPGEQVPEKYGGRRLGDRATRIQVADNIKAFLKVRYKGPKR